MPSTRKESVIKILLYTDGGTCQTNPGPMSYGIVGVKPDTGNTHILLEAHGMIDKGERIGSNNEAEYMAVIMALQLVQQLGFTEVELRVDSNLVCKQLRGEWQIKNDDLRRMHRRAKSWIKRLDSFTVTHVPRRQNKKADRLANVAINLYRYQKEVTSA